MEDQFFIRLFSTYNPLVPRKFTGYLAVLVWSAFYEFG